MILADARSEIAGYIQTLAFVYTLILIAYILMQLAFAFGARIPYARWSDALMTFLRDVSEPYLRIFRRFIPPIGPLDISPMIAIFALNIVASIVAGVIEG